MPVLRPMTGSGLFVLLLLAACGGGRESATNDGAPAAPGNDAAAPTPAPTASSTNASAVTFKEGEIDFRYSWPAQASAIPELDSWLRGNGEKLRADMMKGARAEQKAAKETDYEFRGYSYSENWNVAADLPALLVMQSDGYSYTGGAHGMPIVTTLFWDKATKKRLATTALIDLVALKSIANDRFCTALDEERAKRRGAPVDRSDKNEIVDFVSCVDLTKQTILPVSTGGKALDTIRILILPYEAGPYAEGIYEIDLPVDGALMGAVKPAWRASFASTE